MSYLVLARKWRPKRFAELVGQEHVVRALTNALETGRVHHAFLFTGTRGVGKTTIARIFAKSLNCERGAGADPCGECETCLAIDAGRYIDLLEIDAASNTGVDNVRELIENAQYMPSRGRYKVYLIDEVHMLSKAAFNALLKTLEEPPEHVKFLFATTDPEKLLVTVLSRCLQFNLKRLDEAQIGGQITMILGEERIAGDADAVRQLAKAADGSLRDGLSLLDQAIAYTGGALTGESVAAMLGTVDRARVGALLSALASGDGAALLDEVTQLAGFSPDWSGVLDALAEALHRIQVRQLVPGAEIEASAGLDVDALASALRPEVVQLWYQMALSGRRDLHFAPSARAGFEMAVLRMLAFRPGDGGAASASSGTQASAGGGLAAARAAVSGASAAAPAPRASAASPASTPASASAHAVPATAAVLPPRAVQPQAPASASPAAARPSMQDAPPWSSPGAVPLGPHVHSDAAPAPRMAPAAPVDSPAEPHAVPAAGIAPDAASAPPASTSTASPAGKRAAVASADVDAASWPDLIGNLTLRGPARELGLHAAFVAYADGVLRLALPTSDDHLKAPFLVSQLANAISPAFGGRAPDIRFDTAAPAAAETLHGRTARQRDQRQSAAEDAFLDHPDVQRLMSQQGAKLVPDSIRPFED